jgi:hypothetical protein
MRYFLFIIALSSSFSFADDVSEMRAVLEANFDACNKEDVNALLETCSLDMPRREEFRIESKKLWQEKDIYYRLARFKVIQIEGDYATASVVQISHVKDRASNDEHEAFLRNGTTLLTRDECVEYKVAFKKDSDVWKCYLTLTEPVKFDLDLEH